MPLNRMAKGHPANKLAELLLWRWSSAAHCAREEQGHFPISAPAGGPLMALAGGCSAGGSALRRKDQSQEGTGIDAHRLTELHIIDDADLPFAPFELGNARLVDAESFGQFDLGKAS